MIYFVISGDADIRPAGEMLKRRGQKVFDDTSVQSDAGRLIRGNKKFLVVAHGSPDGRRVLFHFSASGKTIDWIYHGMKNPPTGPRIYLYCCFAGIAIPRVLKGCETFGHHHEVPMPHGIIADDILEYLAAAAKLMESENFHRETWRRQLLAVAERAYTRAFRRQQMPNVLAQVPALRMLAKSLGAPQ